MAAASDQPHVGADRLVAADAFESLLLQQTQHLGLQWRRHVANLVEEEGAARDLLELADAAAVGPGEGAFLVPEQLRLLQVLRDGGAVDGQERRLGAGPVLVNCAGDQLFAGATPDRLEALKRKLDDGQPMAFESRHRRRDGVVFPVEIRGQAFWEGGRRFAVALARDVTERKRAEAALRESEERFRGTFENAPVGIVHNDNAGRFLRVNGTYCAIVGYSRVELVQKTLPDIIHPEDLAAHVELYESCFTRGESPAFGMKRRYQRKDGSAVWVEVFSSFQRDASGRPVYAIAAVQDISERKRLGEEVALRRRRRQEAANRAKDDFLANVKPRNPHPPERHHRRGRTRKLDTPLDEGQRQGFEDAIKSAADSLLGIINDLLDFSKIEAGKLELVPADFSLRVAVGDTLRTLAVRTHKKGLELVCHVQPNGKLPRCPGGQSRPAA